MDNIFKDKSPEEQRKDGKYFYLYRLSIIYIFLPLLIISFIGVFIGFIVRMEFFRQLFLSISLVIECVFSVTVLVIILNPYSKHYVETIGGQLLFINKTNKGFCFKKGMIIFQNIISYISCVATIIIMIIDSSRYILFIGVMIGITALFIYENYNLLLLKRESDSDASGIIRSRLINFVAVGFICLEGLHKVYFNTDKVIRLIEAISTSLTIFPALISILLFIPFIKEREVVYVK